MFRKPRSAVTVPAAAPPRATYTRRSSVWQRGTEVEAPAGTANASQRNSSGTSLPVIRTVWQAAPRGRGEAGGDRARPGAARAGLVRAQRARRRLVGRRGTRRLRAAGGRAGVRPARDQPGHARPGRGDGDVPLGGRRRGLPCARRRGGADRRGRGAAAARVGLRSLPARRQARDRRRGRLALPAGRGRRPRQVGWRKLGRLRGRRDGREARRERRRGHDRAERGVREGRAAGADPQRRRLAPELVSERQQQKAEAFRALHEGEPFVIPNPWDAGSARMLESLGFQALATTSSGFAFTLGRPDGQVSLDEVGAHVRLLCEVSDLPVSVDLEDGYDDPAEAIRRVAEAGAVGGSIEDSPGEGVYPLGQALERLGPAVGAARSLDFPFTLTARAENHIRGNPDLDDTIARLQAYEQADADLIFAPGLREVAQVRAIS